MSQSAIFDLVLRDDRFDRSFTASDFLRQRLLRIRQAREKAGWKDPLPTFTDLRRSHLLYVEAQYQPYVSIASEYIRVRPKGDIAKLTVSGGGADFTLPTYGHFTSDMVFHLRFDPVGTANPVISAEAEDNPSPRYRFCAYPGMRVFPRVEFRSTEVSFDDYTRDELIFVNDFRISDDRRTAWDRGMGQAPVQSAEYFNSNGRTDCVFYKEGLQTPKFLHPTQDLWIPAQFWMCESPGTALLNDLIGNTQRKISVRLAPLGEIVQALDQNSGEIIPLPISQLGIKLDLYVNNLFVNPEVYDLFAARIGESLIRVHRRQTISLSQTEGRYLLRNLKYPAEYLYIGTRDRANADDFDHWHLFGRRRTRTDATAILVPAAIWNEQLQMCQLVCRTAKETSTLDPIVTDITLTAHGIDLYPMQLPISFYNDYIPQRYFDQTAIISPRDSSALLATFCLFPGRYNPSGYYNLSAGRELYYSYRSADIDVNNPAQLVICMGALNFLVRRGDAVTLRYSL